MPEGRTLAELDVKPGDVVNWPGVGEYEVRDDGRVIHSHGTPLAHGINCQGDQFTIVSRANEPDKPVTWGEMTDAEKGAMLLAALDGNVESKADDAVWGPAGDPVWWGSGLQLRIKPTPKRETVTREYGSYKGNMFCGRGPDPILAPTRSMAFPTLDGNPILGTYTNEAGDVITIEEIEGWDKQQHSSAWQP